MKRVLFSFVFVALAASFSVTTLAAAVDSQQISGTTLTVGTSESARGGTISLLAPNRQAIPGTTFLYPILIDIDGFNVGDFQFEIGFNPAVVNPSGPNFGCSAAGTMSGNAGIPLFCNVIGGNTLSIMGFSSGTTMTGQGILLNIQLTVAPGAPVGSSSNVPFSNVFFFELAGAVPASAMTYPTGLITISGTTAAETSVGGRVSTQGGRPLSGARVSMMDAAGKVSYALTNPFGYFRFDSVQAGETYVVAVRSKRYNFQERVINVGEAVTALDFVAGQ